MAMDEKAAAAAVLGGGTPAGAGSPAPDGPAAAAAGTAAAAPPGSDPVAAIEKSLLEARVIEAMRTVFDPEIPVNIYELGMVYGVDVAPPGDVKVTMTLTSPMCPVAGSLPGEVQAKIAEIPGVREAKVELVWDPPWEPSRMSEAARLELGMM